ncbi:MAG: hypothetical protein AAB783_00890 [Patescibacteria group bacterium]
MEKISFKKRIVYAFALSLLLNLISIPAYNLYLTFFGTIVGNDHVQFRLEFERSACEYSTEGCQIEKKFICATGHAGDVQLCSFGEFLFFSYLLTFLLLLFSGGLTVLIPAAIFFVILSFLK